MSPTTQTLLNLLRTLSKVDCDTLDAEVSKQLGPFHDCTSNQAISYNELSKTDAEGKLIHHQLIVDSITYAKSKTSDFHDVDIEEIAVEAMTVKLAHRIAPYLTGFSHLQTNPKYSFDTKKTIANARRFVTISKELDPDFDVKKLCIKIPATWEGCQACETLEAQGLATLGTAVGSLQQALLASRVGCTYIAPYINELRVHFDASYVDDNQAFQVCAISQRFYHEQTRRTKVLAASLTSIDEVMKLAGVDHITVAPALLDELSRTPVDSYQGAVGSVFRELPRILDDIDRVSCQDELAWRLAFGREQDGKSETRLKDAIELFGKKQDALERLAQSYL
ncbi:transaldolase [Astrocystis sublimbata]|nr:transaldolase [Astrocystis sublimbata]